MMLLSEICEMTGVTRRAIQEYENYSREIAIKPTKKKNMDICSMVRMRFRGYGS